MKYELKEQLEFLKKAQKDACTESDYEAVAALSKSILATIAMLDECA